MFFLKPAVCEDSGLFCLCIRSVADLRPYRYHPIYYLCIKNK